LKIFRPHDWNSFNEPWKIEIGDLFAWHQIGASLR